jgi:hypothetical protein
MKKIIYFLFFIAFGAQAQNVKTTKLQWNVSTIFNAALGQTLEEQQQFITEGDTLKWKNSTGELIHAYGVLEILGNWTNVNQMGSIVYKITAGEQRGTIEISKQIDTYRIRIAITDGDSQQAFELTAQSFQTL